MVAPIILALDTKDVSKAQEWIEIALPQIRNFKIGLEFYLKNGFAAVEKLIDQYQFDLFLDLKLHDIPNTVKGAVESVASLKPKFLTVHASGGAKMIEAAAGALPYGSITAVTVLTSFTESDFLKLGHANKVEETVKLWATIAIESGATSIVCSPFEAKLIRAISNDVVIITPGVRVLGDEIGDQARVMTPADAIRNGADFVVIGRSITKESVSGAEAMRVKINQIIDSLNS